MACPRGRLLRAWSVIVDGLRLFRGDAAADGDTLSLAPAGAGGGPGVPDSGDEGASQAEQPHQDEGHFHTGEKC